MKIETSQVTKVVISGLLNDERYRLDPVTVFLEDTKEDQGRITIVCYDKAWTSYWGAMSGRKIAEFFCSSDEYYIAKNLSPDTARSINAEGIELDNCSKKALIRLRRAHCLDKNKARVLWEEIDDPFDTAEKNEVLEELYGVDWFMNRPWMPNPKYKYLCRIIGAVRDALISECPEVKSS